MALRFGAFGNGVSVWRTGSSSFVAHISTDKKVTYDADHILTEDEKQFIESFAEKLEFSSTYSQGDVSKFDTNASD